MHVTGLRIRDLRNLADVRLEPHPRFNVLEGENGQGKTNLLESLFWLATLRPLRATRLRELVAWGAAGCRVAATVEHEGLEHRLAVSLRGGERVAEREGKTARTSDYFGALAVVVFVPDDVGLVRGPPEDRRRFLDRAVFTGRPAHLADVLAYRRALDGRNRLLRDGADSMLFDAYEQALADAGARLHGARSDYVERLSTAFVRAFEGIAGSGLPASIAYRPGIELDERPVAEALTVAWRAGRAHDRQRGFTQRGPHTADLSLRLFERSARSYASQGQQRAIVLALKIAEIQLLEQTTGTAPVLLLDDVSSELDERRNARLFEFLEGFGGQVFITTTDSRFLHIETDRRVWSVAAGAVTPREA